MTFAERLDKADAGIGEAISGARDKVGGLNYVLGSWFVDTDPLAEVKQVERYRDTWRESRKAKEAAGLVEKDVATLEANAARYASLAWAIAGVAAPLTATNAAATIAADTAKDAADAAKKATSVAVWWVLPLAAVGLVAFAVVKVAGVFGGKGKAG